MLMKKEIVRVFEVEHTAKKGTIPRETHGRKR